MNNTLGLTPLQGQRALFEKAIYEEGVTHKTALFQSSGDQNRVIQKC